MTHRISRYTLLGLGVFLLPVSVALAGTDSTTPGDVELLPPTQLPTTVNPNSNVPCTFGSNQVLVLNGNGTNGTSAINCNSNLVADPVAGTVGIGTATPQTTLDVNGGLRIATDHNQNGGTGCTSNNAGVLSMYNGQISLCNGTSWINLAGGWINVPSSITQYNQSSSNAVAVYATVGEYSPTAWCQANGYNSATGNCRGKIATSDSQEINNFQNTTPLVYGGASFEGITYANSTLGQWSWACQFGAGADNFYIDNNTQIHCDGVNPF